MARSKSQITLICVHLTNTTAPRGGDYSLASAQLCRSTNETTWLASRTCNYRLVQTLLLTHQHRTDAIPLSVIVDDSVGKSTR